MAQLFEKIKVEAQKIGGNSFLFESYRKVDDENGELVLAVYYSEDVFDENFANLPHDKIFVFGSQNLLDSRSQGYKVQGEKFEIESGKYRVFEIRDGDEIKINKGGFTGMTLWISRSGEGYSSFLSFSGVGVGGASVNSYGGVGVNINTGTIHRVEVNLALTLLKMFSEQK